MCLPTLEWEFDRNLDFVSELLDVFLITRSQEVNEESVHGHYLCCLTKVCVSVLHCLSLKVLHTTAEFSWSSDKQ